MTPTAYTRALAARLLAEANDIKRTPRQLAEDLGLPVAYMMGALAGELEPEEYRALFTSMAERYPIAFTRLWMEAPDTNHGVLHVKADQSAQTSRLIERPDRTGRSVSYYEYRDAAMSRNAPFRPEWIRVLRAVDDLDPSNPDVILNNGHFLHQTTFFVGPVNFYWEVWGKRHVVAAETGDSNYITPFWPHSFATRDPSKRAYIIAVTYGGEVARARDELAWLGEGALADIVLDVRSPTSAYGRHLLCQLANEAMTTRRFCELCRARGLSEKRVEDILRGRWIPGPNEVSIMAEVLGVTPRDLILPERTDGDEVVFVRRGEAESYLYPDETSPCYQITRLARTRHQPYVKSFSIHVLPGDMVPERRFTVLLHQFIYNYGEAPMRLTTHADGCDHLVLLAPGDSAYVYPLVPCSFSTEGRDEADVFVVRVPGSLHADAVLELSGMAPRGIGRAGTEVMSWF